MARLDPLFDEAISKRASDLHVAPARPPFARIRGELVSVADGVLNAKDVEEMIDEYFDWMLDEHWLIECCAVEG